MGWFIGALLILLACFSLVLLVGPPYLPTLSKQMQAGLDLLDLKAGDTLLELGCGDGRVLLAAAQRGWNVVGYELNPILAIVCWLRTRRHRKQVKVVWGNFWTQDWPEADAIFVFLLPRLTEKLNKKIMQYPFRPVKLASFAFVVRSRQPTREKAGIYLYEYDT